MTYKYLLLTAILFGFSAQASTAEKCELLLNEHLQTDLQMAALEFDQSTTAGFRKLDADGCTAEAAVLIERFIARQSDMQRLMWFHSAQLKARIGDYSTAIVNAEKSMQAKEDFEKNPIRWNDYVLGVIAFWKRDRTALLTQLQAVEQVSDFPPNAVNARMLKRLAENFDKSYAQILSR